MRRTLRRTVAAVAMALCAAVLPAPLPANAAPPPAPARAAAQWIDRDTVVWKGARHAPAQLEFGVEGEGQGLIRLAPAALGPAERAAYPHLKDFPAFAVDPRDQRLAATALRERLVAVQRDADGRRVSTGVQIPGVLDDLYGPAAATVPLGPVDRKSVV